MTIWFECICGERLSAPDAGAGRMGRCPYCRCRIRVPGKSTIPENGRDSNEDSQIVSLPDEALGSVTEDEEEGK